MFNDDIQHSFALIPDFEGDINELVNISVPDSVPVLPLRNIVCYPMVMIPVRIGRKSSMRLVKEAYERKTIIGAFTQKRANDDVPGFKDLEALGVACRVAKIIDFPDGNHTAILQCIRRIVLTGLVETGRYLTGSIITLDDNYDSDEEFNMICDLIRQRVAHLLESTKEFPADAQMALQNMGHNSFLVNFACSSLPVNISTKISLLRDNTIKARAVRLLAEINKLQSMSDLRNQIEERTQNELNKQQREYFLNHEIKVIQEELGGPSGTKDVDDLSAKADALDMPENVREIFNTELAKLQRLNMQTPDYNVQLNYLQTIVGLPWNKCTKDNLNINNAEKVLNHDHYGMEKVKERILEHLAVLKLRGDMKSPILCLYGPPGVGKTSLGHSIADALKRKYVRASLGGLHDESEVRGHRRTYIGAMPGRILKGIMRAGYNNPVFILDEIDKISGQTVNGDPSSALLEVLDPEQNTAFHDNFLDIDYDLSNVMFIATANDISSIPRPLLDRMELIEVGGYCTEEKIEIARRHLVPKAMEANGLGKRKDIKVSKAAIEFIIEHYTRESGVRGLEKMLNKLFRKVALNYARQEDEAGVKVDVGQLKDLLGKEPYNRDIYQGNENAGVVTGLAWTSVGGEILFIETSLSKGKGSRLTLTGNLGDVMKESAMLAIEYIKAHAEALNIDHRIFDQWNIHVHVPEGATPKDGPSAGVTMVTSIVSAITQRKVRAKLAMTGEITLRGKVLPVGGIKEKILAAKRAGIKEIVICKENRKDVEEIPEMYLTGVSFHYVENIMDVLDYALLKEKVEGAVDFKIEEDDVPTTKD